MSKQGLLAAVATAAGLDAAAADIKVDAAFITAHFPDVAAALKAEGADAEHARVTGIEAAALPGFDAIISAHKADRSKTPEQAAFAVLAASRAQAAAVAASLKTDEEKLAGLKAAPDASGDAAAQHPAEAARAIATRANAYIAEQAAKGLKVSPADAVTHVSKEG